VDDEGTILVLQVENFLLHFWQGMPPHLLSVLPNEVVVDLVALCDIMLYKVVTNVLISSPLQNFPERWIMTRDDYC